MLHIRENNQGQLVVSVMSDLMSIFRSLPGYFKEKNFYKVWRKAVNEAKGSQSKTKEKDLSEYLVEQTAEKQDACLKSGM
jgi:hypothetical protein